MGDIIDSSGYRANVGIVLMHGNGSVFLGRRPGGAGWQFPQGGVRQGERLEEAVYRELHEEVGLNPSDVDLIGRSSDWLRYRLPPHLVRREQRPRCIGQKQRWFLLRLKHDEARFDFKQTTEPEFDQWRWASFWDPVREVVYFKRAVYVAALQELAPFAFPSGQPPLPSWWNEMVAAGEEPLGSTA